MSNVTTQTLHVVAREVNNELNDARNALELFGEQQDNVDLLQKCREHLRLVRGALRLVEVFGAALLVEEMEQLAQYLIDNIGQKRHLPEGLDALMRSMVQLPTYLERVMGGGRDMALVLLPLLNDLRAVRGNPLLSEGTLLLLNLSSDQPANPQAPAPGEPNANATQWSRKMRTRFQLGLLGWIKGERIEQNLEILARAAEKLEHVAVTQPVFQLWWVVGAVLEALREGGLDSTASIKRLLGQADREMKRLYTEGESKYCEKPPLDLLNNLLYYVARAASDGARVAAVRASFRLNDLLPVDAQVEAARQSLSAPSVKLMKTVASAIKEDLARVKDALDIFVRKGGMEIDELAPQLELLKKIGDTLGVLGLGDLREQVQQQTTMLQEMLQSHATVDDSSLMSMASTLISVEDGLDSQLVGLIMPEEDGDAEGGGEKPDKDVEFRQVSEAVLRECIVNMARIKESIALALEHPGETQTLDQIPQLIRGINAGLLMLGKTRAVAITERIRNALDRYARPEILPRIPEKMDRLADAIVAVEYYLETLQAGRNDPWYMLDNAEGCLQVLDDMSKGGTGMYRIPQNLTNIMSATQIEPTMANSIHSATRVLEPGARNEPTQIIRDKEPVLDESRIDHSATMINLPPVLVKPEDKASPEFLELFIEEAREEITKLQQLLPRWDEDPQNMDALTQMRRSFHTLKGSGRLVGAQLIGEFAWSMENMLNRIISKTLDRTPEMMELLRQAVATLPELAEQLESGRAPQGNIGALISWAYTFAGTRDQKRNSSDTGMVPSLKMSDAAKSPSQSAPAKPAAPVAEKKATNQSPVSMDPTLHDIFSKEVAGHIAAIREYVHDCSVLPPPYSVTEVLHRACHTISGASKTAAVRQSIKIAEPLNHYIRKLYDNSAPLPAEGLMLLNEAASAIDTIISHVNEDSVFFKSQSHIAAGIQALEQKLDQELSQRESSVDSTSMLPAADQTAVNQYTMIDMSHPGEIPRGSETITENDVLSVRDNEEEEEWVSLTVDDLQKMVESPIETVLRKGPAFDPISEYLHPQVNPDGTPDQYASNAATARNQALPDYVAEDFHTGTHTHIVLDSREWDDALNAAIKSESAPVLNTAAEVINDSAATAKVMSMPMPPVVPVPPVVQVVEPSPEISTRLSTTATISELNPDRRSSNRPMSKGPAMNPQSITTAPAELDAVPVAADEEFDAEVAAIFSEEASELLEVADSSFNNWRGDRGNQAQSHELKRALHTIKGGARMAGIRSMGDLSHELESFMEMLEHGVVTASPQVFEMLQNGLDVLHRMRDVVAEGKNVSGAPHLIARIKAMAKGEPPPAVVTPQVAEVIRNMPAANELPFITSFAGDDLQHPQSGNQIAEHSIHLDLPQEHLHPNAFAPTQALEVMHSFSAAPMEEFDVHELSDIAPGPAFAPPTESTIDFELPNLPNPVTPPEVTEVVLESHDLDAHDEEVMHDITPHLDDVVAAPQMKAPEPASFDVATPVASSVSNTAPTTAPVVSEVVAAPAVTPAHALPGREQQTHERGEVARVDADLLDDLLNNAGEVSILRSRLEQQVSQVEFNLSELNRTVSRLKDQLRNLELETEAQILHKHQDDSHSNEDFDPLELDRYSTIQQFSRALAESVSDVASLENLLGGMTREAQNLLLQQSRVVTELQNGLMRTRMVPFSRHVQRLTRLVRQVAGETGKQVELNVVGAGGELDRQVLERMLPPFEHMLRNSIIHGIETPDERVKRNKAAGGTITVKLHREGSEMVIILQDDGRGIDVNAVREKAKAKGMIPKDRVLTDEEAMQLILEPGFSTATTVTQHAGRGVGMDVVVNEIKKLGGALFTESKFGEGVKFTIRLPFTLAVSQALLVRVGDNELYALPLSSVEGVVRMNRSEVEAHLAAKTPLIYGGQTYKFQNLGAFIDGPASMLPEGDEQVPLILIKAGEHSTALLVDEMMGNREIVVKSVGPQIAGIRGISGAAILGDGRVVIILDMGALVRSEWRSRAEVEAEERMLPRGDERRTMVLVVDDSITVRRVTQRLLERNGMRVITAKDGVDAWETMQEHVPDIILLDVEMPRMDGYELAGHVRSDERLKNVPIIMITSRVGEKHRARAIEVGVNDYLGKPYQDNQLLDAMEAQLRGRRRMN
ncbi:MAG TPA: Hpt domain-containing protein [Steroidobacteraceae bacterium]|nr:Hpt domain-containing protein [Steroidobacteraceae bacterium]